MKPNDPAIKAMKERIAAFVYSEILPFAMKSTDNFTDATKTAGEFTTQLLSDEGNSNTISALLENHKLVSE